MNRKRIEKMIPVAMEAMKNVGIITEKGELPSNYSGYIDSFGPTIIQSGLLSAICFNDKNGERGKINELIEAILKKYGLLKSDEKLIEKVRSAVNGEGTDLRKIKGLVMEAIVACKLAAKTFPKKNVKERE